MLHFWASVHHLQHVMLAIAMLTAWSRRIQAATYYLEASLSRSSSGCHFWAFCPYTPISAIGSTRISWLLSRPYWRCLTSQTTSSCAWRRHSGCLSAWQGLGSPRVNLNARALDSSVAAMTQASVSYWSFERPRAAAYLNRARFRTHLGLHFRPLLRN